MGTVKACLKSGAGFTLIEVMVALIIVGLLLLALLMAFANQSDGIAYIRDQSIAQWVASNQLVQTRIEVGKTRQVFQGEREGVSSMAGRDWHWWISSGETGVENFYRIEVRVALEDSNREQPLHTLIGFVSGPAGAPSEG